MVTCALGELMAKQAVSFLQIPWVWEIAAVVGYSRM